MRTCIIVCWVIFMSLILHNDTFLVSKNDGSDEKIVCKDFNIKMRHDKRLERLSETTSKIRCDFSTNKNVYSKKANLYQHRSYKYSIVFDGIRLRRIPNKDLDYLKVYGERKIKNQHGKTISISLSEKGNGKYRYAKSMEHAQGNSLLFFTFIASIVLLVINLIRDQRISLK